RAGGSVFLVLAEADRPHRRAIRRRVPADPDPERQPVLVELAHACDLPGLLRRRVARAGDSPSLAWDGGAGPPPPPPRARRRHRARAGGGSAVDRADGESALVAPDHEHLV